MFKSLLFQLDTLNPGPGLLRLESWRVILSLQKAIHVEVHAALLLKKASDVI